MAADEVGMASAEDLPEAAATAAAAAAAAGEEK